MNRRATLGVEARPDESVSLARTRAARCSRGGPRRSGLEGFDVLLDLSVQGGMARELLVEVGEALPGLRTVGVDVGAESGDVGPKTDDVRARLRPKPSDCIQYVLQRRLGHRLSVPVLAAREQGSALARLGGEGWLVFRLDLAFLSGRGHTFASRCRTSCAESTGHAGGAVGSRARAMGGGSGSRPRCLRTATMASRSLISATTRRRAPQGHARMSCR